MGRQVPELRMKPEVRAEVELARAIDEAVSRVLSTDGGVDLDVVTEVARILAEAGGELRAPGPAGSVPAIREVAAALDGVEATQAVQDLDHSVPLIAGKATIVRVYLSYRQSVDVRGELQVARTATGPWVGVTSIGTAKLDPARSGGSLAQLRSRRADLAFSLNFRLPEEVTATGDLWLRLGPLQRPTGTALPSWAGGTTGRITFRRGAPLRLRLVRFRYRMGSPVRTHQPSTTDVDLIASWLRRAYPIAVLDITTTTAAASPVPPFEAAEINAQLVAMRAVDVATGTDPRTHYYGMVADSGFFMRGRASAIPQSPRPGTVASGPTGPGSAGWDFDGSYGDWYGGHELGHTFGRFHVEFCGASGGRPYPFPKGQLSGSDERFVGIDVGDPAFGLPMQALRGTTSHDVMTYCDDEWLSSFTYRGIFDRLVAEDALPAVDAPPIRLGPRVLVPGGGTTGVEEASMRLIAALNLTRASGSITAILPLGDSVEPVDAGAARYDVSIRVLDAEGGTLDERPAVFVPSACEEPDEDVTGIVDMDVPAPDGAARVEVLVGGRTVAEQRIGGEAVPVGPLTTEHADAGSSAGTAGAVDLRWEQPAGSSAQRYVVQLSEDAGTTWRTVAVGLREPALRLTRDELASDEITVRVLAATGSSAAVVRTDTVRVR